MRIFIDGANRTRVITNDGAEIFISYTTAVAVRLPNGERYCTDKVWSKTTSKMLLEWKMASVDGKPQKYFDDLLHAV